MERNAWQSAGLSEFEIERPNASKYALYAFGHASAPEMACRRFGIPPGFKPLARTSGVLVNWEHRR